MSVAVILTKDFEETEAVTVIDVLIRATAFSNNSDKLVHIISLDDTEIVKGAHGIKLSADIMFSKADFNIYDIIVFPGGPGYANYFKNEELAKIVLNFHENNKIIAAICAAPQYIASLGLLKGKNYTSYPGCDDYLDVNLKVNSYAVSTDNNIITGNSISGAMDFSLLISSRFLLPEQLEQLKKTLARVEK